MQAAGYYPDAVAFLAVINTWAKYGEMRKVHEGITAMLDAGMAPDAFTHVAENKHGQFI